MLHRRERHSSERRVGPDGGFFMRRLNSRRQTDIAASRGGGEVVARLA